MCRFGWITVAARLPSASNLEETLQFLLGGIAICAGFHD